jgi:hypothetical protein
MSQIGFIMLRHVNDAITNTYWIRCYKSIRQFYPEHPILIIDDNSRSECITDEELTNTTIINSDFPRRGELLPYYYYLRNKLFDTAVILHDSVFIQQKIDFSVDTYKMIWTFSHTWDRVEDETAMLETFKDPELLEFYSQKHLWLGCYGGMSVITHDFLKKINDKNNISDLVHYVLSRNDRMSFERVIACLLQKDHITESLFGIIHDFCPWGLTIHEADNYKHLPLLKVWTGR